MAFLAHRDRLLTGLESALPVKTCGICRALPTSNGPPVQPTVARSVSPLTSGFSMRCVDPRLDTLRCASSEATPTGTTFDFAIWRPPCDATMPTGVAGCVLATL